MNAKQNSVITKNINKYVMLAPLLRGRVGVRVQEL
jgi:hypothetical protein